MEKGRHAWFRLSILIALLKGGDERERGRGSCSLHGQGKGRGEGKE